jgi:transposase-like protein
VSRSCTVCSEAHSGDIDAAIVAGQSVREVARTFGIARATLTRHVAHIEVGHPGEGGPAVGPQLAAALKLIEEVRRRRGDSYSAQDECEAVHLRALATAVDGGPTVASMRELRLTLAEFRRAAAPADEAESAAYAALIAALSPEPAGSSHGR